MSIARFTYDRTAPGAPEAVEARLGEELRRRGFGVLSTIRVHEILREKLGERVDPLILLDVCSPRHARDALAATREVATLLPCKVAISQEGGATRVSLQRPTVVLAEFLPRPELKSLGEEVERLLQEAVDAAASPER